MKLSPKSPNSELIVKRYIPRVVVVLGRGLGCAPPSIDSENGESLKNVYFTVDYTKLKIVCYFATFRHFLLGPNVQPVWTDGSFDVHVHKNGI